MPRNLNACELSFQRRGTAPFIFNQAYLWLPTYTSEPFRTSHPRETSWMALTQPCWKRTSIGPAIGGWETQWAEPSENGLLAS